MPVLANDNARSEHAGVIPNGLKTEKSDRTAEVPRDELSESPLRPKKVFILRHGDMEQILTIDDQDGLLAEKLKENFSSHVKASLDGPEQAMTRTDMLLCWMDYLTVKGKLPLLQGAIEELHSSLQGRNVHFLKDLISSVNLKTALRIYYQACHALGNVVDNPYTGRLPAIFAKAVSHEPAVRLSAVFGGQGNTQDHLGEVRELKETYGALIEDLLHTFSKCLLDISRPYIEPPMDILRWLSLSGKGDKIPSVDEDFLKRSSVSLSLVGLVQLLNYGILLRTTSMTPAEMTALFRNATGHSQGIVSAVVFACSQSIEDVVEFGCRALKMLFLVGLRAEQVFAKMESNAMSSSEFVNGVVPTPMLAVSNLSEADLQAIIKETSDVMTALGGHEDCAIEIALVNSPKSFVCSGPTRSLQALYAAIEGIRAKGDEDQSRVPFSQRKKVVNTRFLPISTPFHHSALASIIEPLQVDVRKSGASFQNINLRIPLVCPHSGIVMTGTQADLDKYLIESICTQKVNWMLATSASFHPKITHFVDFGPGGLLGIGVLTHRVREGSGIKVILASTNATPPAGLQNRVHLLDDQNVAFGVNWSDLYGPKVVTRHGKSFVDTKFSRLLNKPPIMVAGMTPTTVSADINIAVAKAGYHVELAGGGHFTESMLADKIDQIVKGSPAASGVTLNALFLNPRLWNQQFPLSVKLRRQGVAMEGLTVAAGVPSLPVANEVITALKDAGFKHVSFKPGSMSAIQEVIAIAKANPDFPVVMQWTGGRGGGHHSYEDFHQPILDSYGAIRSVPNLVLVAGSGFGDGEHSLPYMTGEWSVPYGYPPMPFDGILLGSRMLVCKESKLSPRAKALLVATNGTDNEREWETSYKKPVGGIVTVMSELGEPIHKVATRSVLLWKELDETVFSLPRDKRLPALLQRKDDIINRLNRDHCKVWFPQKSDGSPAQDVSDMTYGEVLMRIIDLCFIKHQGRWIDKSHQPLAFNWAHRIEQRFCTASKYVWDRFPGEAADPHKACSDLLAHYPSASQELVSVEDMHYFVHLCSNFAMKPVPFIPRLDENFEGWFKRDSLWGAEDLDAIPGQDVQRVCILQGPVAVRFSSQVDEPAGKILDDINHYFVEHIPKRNSETEDPEQWIKDLTTQEFVCDDKSHRVGKNGLRGYKYAQKSTGEYVLIAKDGGEIAVEKRGCDMAVRVDAKLTLKFRYEPWGAISTILHAADFAAISDFYWHTWFPASGTTELESLRKTHPWDLEVHTESVVDAKSVEAFCQNVRNVRYLNKPFVPMDYVIVIAWPTVTKLLFAEGISTDNNLLSLVHLNNKYVSLGKRMRIGDKIESVGRITGYTDSPYGRIVQVEAIAHDANTKRPVMRIVSQFLFRESNDRTVSFTRKSIAIDSSEAIQAQPWYKSSAQGTIDKLDLLFLTLKDKTTIKGKAFSGESQVGAIDYDGDISTFDSVVKAASEKIPETAFSQPVDLGEERLVSLTDSAKYSGISGDHNPIHTNGVFAKLAGLPQTITHGMWSSAAIKGLAEAKLLPILKKADASESLQAEEEVVEWQTDFTDIVRPGDSVQVTFSQVGVRQGMRVVEGVATVQERQCVKFRALLSPVPTAYVFTGQGSQSPNMGMDLYDKSPVAKAVWDQADRHFRTNYGFSILDIVRRNPLELTIHFGGEQGPRIRDNYRSLQVEVVDKEGNSRMEALFPEIHADSESYTFKSPSGLLHATQFTQPALVLLEQAAYADMVSNGLVPRDVRFAGHSLGEYAALAAIGNIIGGDDLCDIVFYRGLTMQRAVPRDPVTSESGFGMIAINPSRVHANFDAYALDFVIKGIKERAFLEIVNYNIEGQQYVVAGRVEALECLTQLMNFLWHNKIDIKLLRAKLSEEDIRRKLDDMIGGVWEEKCQIVREVSKGIASVPLPGIDVPFHSSSLLPGVPAFRAILTRKLKVRDIHVQRMNGRYIPNLIGEPFHLDKPFLERVYAHSQSPIIQALIDDWHVPKDVEEEHFIGHKVLVELLAYQFASPVQWIKTQRVFFEQMDVQRLVEVGPGPILAGMAERTLKRYAKSDAILGRKRLVQSYQRDNDDIYYRTLPTTDKPAIDKKNDGPAKVDSSPPVVEVPKVVVGKPRKTWESVPFTALDSLQVILGYKLKKKDVPVTKSIKELSMGKSTLQNELFGDLLREFGDGKTPENKAEELSLADLAKEIDAKLGSGFPLPGKQIQTYVNKMASGKFNSLSQLEEKLGSGYGVQSGQAVQAILAYGLLQEPPQRLLDDGQVNEWLAQVVSHFATTHSLDLIPSSGSAGSSDGGSAVVVSSEELKLLERKQLEFFKKQLDLLAEHTGDTGRDILAALQGKVKECQALQSELALWNVEYTPEHLALIRPLFNAKQVRTFNSYWNWARENVVRKVLTGRGDPNQVVGCAEEDGRLSEFVSFIVHKISGGMLDTSALEASAASKPLSEGARLSAKTVKQISICSRSGRRNARLTQQYRKSLTEDLSFAGKCVLVTGAGPNSIGSELVAFLLRGGAHVVVTTSNLTRNVGFFEGLYRRHCAKGSILQVVPFNAASQSDCHAVLSHIHDTLKLELDAFVPFAAINEVGRDISRIDHVSEAAHRAMLVNVERMLGAICEHKRALQLATRPVTVLLPMSPNEGDFGGDGLYGETKAALKAMLGKWQSERSWAPFSRLVGAVIGWTKGTGLMADNDVLAAYLERKHRIQTFTSHQMGWMCASLLSLPYGKPCVARLTGGLERLMPHFGKLMDDAKQALIGEFKARALKTTEPAGLPDRKARFDFGFPLWHHQHPIKKTHAIEMDVVGDDEWLDKTVVVTGYGEVGPWGNARTRWAMESHMRAGRATLEGLMPLEAVIELAWIMGLVQLQRDGWHDAKTGKLVADADIAREYEPIVVANCGIRKITAEDAQGYDPEHKPLAQEVVLAHPLGPFDVTKEEKEAFARFHPAGFLDIREGSNGRFSVKLLPGATLLLPKAASFDRLVAGLLPRGWSAERLGLPAELARQVDPTTAYTLAATSEALVMSGIVDAYELYEHVHVSDVGNTIGGGNGGMASNRVMFTQRFRDQTIPNDILQESFINTMPAWVNMLLLSSSGPIRTAVGACATALASVDNGVDLLQQGKAKIVVCGGNDDFGEQGSYEFAQMGATSNAVHEMEQGRLPWQHCRPMADTRGGFLESHGAGVQVLMTARTAIDMGAPIYAVLAASHTASDGAGRSVPAPGQGILSGADCILRGLQAWGLTADDIDVASFHGTGTKANDWNECAVLSRQLQHWGRKPGRAVAGIFQKHLTGHPKAPAAAWMLNGAMQALNAGIIPGHGTIDNVDPQLKPYGEYVWVPSEPHHVASGLKAALIKSFGFGQVGGEVLVVRGDLCLARLPADTLQAYMSKLAGREQRSKRYWQEAMMHDAASRTEGLIRVKSSTPYAKDDAHRVYLDRRIRLVKGKIQIPREGPTNAQPTNAQSNDAQPNDANTHQTNDDAKIEDVKGPIKEQIKKNLQRQSGSVGVDVQQVSDFPHHNDDFASDNFTTTELKELRSKPDVPASMAGRWAAKEAIFKLLSSAGASSSKRTLKWIEVLNDPATGAPVCTSHPDICVSISHSGDYAVAVAQHK